MVLDSGALIALARSERAMWRRLKTAQATGENPLTHGGVLGQVWRDGARQARLAQALPSIDVRPLDARLGRSAGELLAAAKHDDVIDAAVVLLAKDGDLIVTSDPDDLRALAAASRRHVELVRP